jgi:hypothetical protein
MQHVPLDGKLYIGGDIVQEMVEKLQQRHWSRNREFRLLDIVDDPLPEADIWMCRDMLFHLPEADALKVLRRAGQSNIKYFLSSTFTLLSAAFGSLPNLIRAGIALKGAVDEAKLILQHGVEAVCASRRTICRAPSGNSRTS